MKIWMAWLFLDTFYIKLVDNPNTRSRDDSCVGGNRWTKLLRIYWKKTQELNTIWEVGSRYTRLPSMCLLYKNLTVYLLIGLFYVIFKTLDLHMKFFHGACNLFKVPSQGIHLTKHYITIYMSTHQVTDKFKTIQDITWLHPHSQLMHRYSCIKW